MPPYFFLEKICRKVLTNAPNGCIITSSSKAKAKRKEVKNESVLGT